MFKPNAATDSAVRKPVRYAVALGILLFILFCVIGAAQHNLVIGAVFGAGLGFAVGLFNFTAFRQGGWGQRWHARHRES